MILEPVAVKLRRDAVVLRSPAGGEGKALLTFFQSLFHESSEYLNYPADHYDNQITDQQENFIENFSAAKDSLALFAFHDQEAVGSVVLKNFGYPAGRHCATLSMGVLKSWHGQGLGYSMLKHVMNLSQNLGISHIELRVRSHNQIAINLYEKAGFTRTGIIPQAACMGGQMEDEYLYYWNQ